jgi:RND family efflux transporter MFP subunit
VGAGGDKTLLTTIVNDDSIYAYFNIGERDLLDFEQRTIQEGKDREKRIGKPIYPVFLGLQNEEGFPHEGKIDFIANQMDPDTGTIEMRGVFPNPDGKLHSGLFARLKVPIGLPAEKLLVPERAIGADQRGRYLLAVSAGNEVQYKAVQLGTLVDDLQVVEKGVGPDDRIIVTGLLRVRPGLKVTPKEASTPPANSAEGAKSP